MSRGNLSLDTACWRQTTGYCSHNPAAQRHCCTTGVKRMLGLMVSCFDPSAQGRYSKVDGFEEKLRFKIGQVVICRQYSEVLPPWQFEQRARNEEDGLAGSCP